MEQADWVFPIDNFELFKLNSEGAFSGYSSLIRKTVRYLSTASSKGKKLNVEAGLNAEFLRLQKTTASIAKQIEKGYFSNQAKCLCPLGGIQDNTVNRLLVMSSPEHHLSSVPMALFFEHRKRS